jgi:hypothetical protein
MPKVLSQAFNGSIQRFGWAAQLNYCITVVFAGVALIAVACELEGMETGNAIQVLVFATVAMLISSVLFMVRGSFHEPPAMSAELPHPQPVAVASQLTEEEIVSQTFRQGCQ